MRTILTFSIIILPLCIGCPNTAVKEKPKAEVIVEPTEMFENEGPEPYVEPMYPQKDGESEDTTLQSAMSAMFPAFSGVLGKYASEIVPLPPLDDLTAQIDDYITKIGISLDDLDGSPKYAEDAGGLVRDANALALVALAIGLAEADSKYKKRASQIISSAKILAAAKNLDDGQKAYTALKASLTGRGDGKPLTRMDKIADLAPAMKALPNLSSAVKRRTDTERKLNIELGGARAQQVYSQLAALSVIAQGCVPNVTETTKPDAMAEWKKFCEEFRDAALKTNVAAHQYAKDKADDKEPNYAAFNTSFKTMMESCDSCHKVFYPSAVGKNE